MIGLLQKTPLKYLFGIVLKSITPPSCVACGVLLESKVGLCAKCWSQLHFISRPFCEKYAVPFGFDAGDGNLSPEAIAHPPPWGKARAAVLFNDQSKDLVHGLKYYDRQDYAQIMASMMMSAARDVLPEVDIVCPIPLFWQRQFKRRYNQSALLARVVARSADKSFHARLLRRKRATPSQIGLSREARERNVQGAFKVQNKKNVDGKTILLVDDVMTSGATLKAATKTLLKAGAKQVHVLVFARVTEVIG